MKNKTKLQYRIILLLLALALLPLISAFEISTTSYEIGSFHTGLAGGNSSTSSYEFRHTTTYQQGSNRDSATIGYSANIGWLNNTLYINNDELPIEEEVCSSQNLNLCTTESSCTNVGGYWYNSICNTTPQPETQPETPARRSGDGGAVAGKVVESIEKKVQNKSTKRFKVGDKIIISIKNGETVLNFTLELSEIEEEDILIKVYLEENETKTKKTITGNVLRNFKKEILSVRLKLNQEKKLDLTNDGFYDLLVELADLSEKEAIIRAVTIHEEPEEEEIPKEPELATPATEIGTLDLIKPLVILTILALLISVLIVSYFVRKRLKIRGLEGRLKEIKSLKIRKKIDRQAYYREKDTILEKIHKTVVSSKSFVIAVLGMVLIISSLIVGVKITGLVVSSGESLTAQNYIGLVLLTVAMAAAFLILTLRKRISERAERIRMKKHPKNSAKGLINRQVYTEEGDYIGRIKDITFHDGKIHDVKIKLDKRKKFRRKGIIVKYKHVKNTGHIVIIDKNISHHLEKGGATRPP